LTMLLGGGLQQRVYNGRKFNIVEELKRAIISEWKKNCHNVLLTTVLSIMSGVLLLNVLLRITVEE